MLSNGKEIKMCYLKKQLPLLEQPITVRVKFRKVGNLQYISHLDLQRTLHRILVRAGIPMWYTQGFNPHAKIVFSAPLSVGAQSECELVDIRIDREISCEDIKKLLNREVTEELRILDVYIPNTKFSDMIWADYSIEICHFGFEEGIAEKLNEIVARDELVITKKTKSGEKDINIIPLIKSFEAKLSDDCKKIIINAMFSVNPDNYLNPEHLLSAFDRECGVLTGDPDKIAYTIMRNATYFADGVTLFK